MPDQPRQLVFVCRGPHCSERGSSQVRDGLLARLRAASGAPLSVVPYHCFGLCEHGPNVILYPGCVWFRGVQPPALDRLAAHIRGGPPPAELIAEWDPAQLAATRRNLDEIADGVRKDRAFFVEPPARPRWKFW